MEDELSKIEMELSAMVARLKAAREAREVKPEVSAPLFEGAPPDAEWLAGLARTIAAWEGDGPSIETMLTALKKIKRHGNSMHKANKIAVAMAGGALGTVERFWQWQLHYHEALDAAIEREILKTNDRDRLVRLESVMDDNETIVTGLRALAGQSNHPMLTETIRVVLNCGHKMPRNEPFRRLMIARLQWLYFAQNDEPDPYTGESMQWPGNPYPYCPPFLELRQEAND